VDALLNLMNASVGDVDRRFGLVDVRKMFMDVVE
jgi:hypothetical protein